MIISLVLFIPDKTTSRRFWAQYISFKMNGLIVKFDNLTIPSNQITNWVKFCGTPCSIFLRDVTIYYLTDKFIILCPTIIVAQNPSIIG